jgi:hypothetical protein
MDFAIAPKHAQFGVSSPGPVAKIEIYQLLLAHARSAEKLQTKEFVLHNRRPHLVVIAAKTPNI